MIKTKRWVIWVVIGGLAIILLVLSIVLVTRSDDGAMSAVDEQANKELYENGFDEAALPESLSAEFAREVAKGEHAEYQTKESETVYARLTPESLCGALNLERETLGSPRMNASLEKTTALNANAIDYYLDKESIVVMAGVREETFVPEVLVVYGRQGAFYLAFGPERFSGTMYLKRAEVFEGVVDVPDFYVMKGTK